MLVVWCADIDDARSHFSNVFLSEGIPVRYVPLTESPKAGEGDVMLACGKAALLKFQAAGIVAKNRSLGSCRSKVFASPAGTPTVLTFDPRLRHREADKAEEGLWDARLAVRLHETGTLRPDLGDYTWATLADVRERVEKLLASGLPFVPIALDLETMGKFPWYPNQHIITSQWTIGAPGHALVVRHYENSKPLPLDRENLEWLLNHPKIRVWGAGLKFDLVWIAVKWGMECTNFTFDTLLGGSLVNENRSNSLDWHACMYSTIGGYQVPFNSLTPKGKAHHKGHMEEYMDHPLFLDYAGGDPDATFQSALALRAELGKQPKLARFYQHVLHPACRVFEKVERRGLHVDKKAFVALEKEVSAAIEKQTAAAMKALPLKVRAKHSDNLKLTRPVVLRDAFFSPDGWNLKPFKENLTTQKKEPQTTLDHFSKFAGRKGVDAFLKPYQLLKSSQKTLSTYVVGFQKHLRPDGMFHPTYALYRGGLYEDDDEASGTVTGRLAAKNPAIQTLPKHTMWAKALRKCYPAPPGYKFWQLDFSQGELRVMACLANELNMIAAYKAGIDLHSKTAAELNDIPFAEFISWKPKDHPNHDKWAALRQGGKAGNFGLLYAMSAKGFVEYAFNTYGVKIELSKAVAFREAFLKVVYPGLSAYHETQIETAHFNEYVESPMGRIRHLPLINGPERAVTAQNERQAINAPTQITLNDIALLAAVEVEDEFSQEEETFSIRGSSHDALYGYVREGAEMECMVRAKERVRGVRGILIDKFEWTPQLDFPVDFEIGTSWATLESIAV